MVTAEIICSYFSIPEFDLICLLIAIFSSIHALKIICCLEIVYPVKDNIFQVFILEFILFQS